MASESFLRRNPRYREAEWKSRGPREKRPNVRVSNLDTFYAKQAGASSERGSGGEAFEGDSSAEGVARRLAETGRRTGFGGVGIEPNRNLSPRERLNLKTESRTETRAPAGPTDDQRKWAQKFRESSTPSKPLAPTVQDKAGFNPMSPGAEDVPANTSTPTPEKPLNFSRSALIEGAKKSGDFIKTREGFNKQSAAAQTGMEMDDNGSIQAKDKTKVGSDGLTDYAREKFGPAVEDIRAKRDFARGEAMNKSVSQGVGTMTKTNPYGSASATYGGKPTPTPSKPAQVRAAVAGSRPAPLSTAMTGDTGTIKSPLPLPRGGLPAQSSGIATDDPAIRKGISAMSGNQSGLGTINSPFGGGLPFGASASPASGPAQIRKSVSGGSASPTSGPAQALPKASTPNATSSSGSGQRSTGQMPNVGYTNDRSKMSKDEAVEHYQKTGDATALEGYMKANPSEKMKLIQRESDVWNKISENSSAREKALAAQREAESHREEYIKKNNWLGPIGEGATARGWANQNPDKAKALTNYGPSYQDDRKMMDYANRLNAQQVAGSDEKRTSGSTSFNSNNFRRRSA